MILATPAAAERAGAHLHPTLALDIAQAPRALHAAAPVQAERGFAPGSERLNHLFRVALKDGRIHPLYMPLLKYRLARAVPCTR